MELMGLALGITAAVLLHVISRRLPMWAFILISLPGTLLHELSHWLFAFVLRAKPSLPSIIPKKQGNTWCLGSVAFKAKWYSASLVALAPLVVLVVLSSFLLSPSHLAELNPALQFKLVAAVLWFGPALLPSRADWLIAFEYPIPLLVALAFLGFYIF